MRFQSSLSILILLLSVISIAGCAGKSSPPLNYGDGSTGNLLWQSYTRFNAGDYDQTIIYADKIIETYSAEARKMQASLSDYPPLKDVYSYDELNSVAIAFLMRGAALSRKGDIAGAREAYNTVIQDYTFGQSRGGGPYKEDWYKLGELAKQELGKL